MSPKWRLLTALIFLCLVLPASNANGQFGPQQIISSEAIEAKSVYAADLDGDGDLDVLSASAMDSTIAWYENMDGRGTFSSGKIISTNAAGAKFVYAGDLDDDGDFDVVSALSEDNKIAWYENNGGVFSPEKIISTNMLNPLSIHVADMDGDGDLDVLSGSGPENNFESSIVAWHENGDGNGTFSTLHTISTDAYVPFSVFSVDLDGDTDLDVLVAAAYNNKLVWYENTDGQGVFGSEQSISDSGFPAWAFPADFDGDGQTDVLASHGHAGNIAWYRNQTNDEGFGPQQIIGSSVFSNYVPVHAADLDSDGDMDALSASAGDNAIYWHENMDGSGSFNPQQVVTMQSEGTESIHAADLDGDGDLDVLSASSGDNKIAWYETLGTPVNSETEAVFPDRYHLEEAYPNPFNRLTTIGYELNQTSSINIKVYDLQGREIAELTSGTLPTGQYQAVWDASEVPSGIYLYRFQADDYSQTRYVVLVK